jgi:hypothetical protein
MGTPASRAALDLGLFDNLGEKGLFGIPLGAAEG